MMNEALNPNVHRPPASEFEYQAEPGAESQLGKKTLEMIKGKPVTVFSILLIGSIVAGLLGYSSARARENARRQRLIEDWMREVTKWIGPRGGKIANPLKEAYEATRSAVEDVPQAGARLAQRLNPFITKQNKKVFGIF